MEKKWKYFNDDCPNCGDTLEVLSGIPEDHDSESEIEVYDGEDIRCMNCGFRSCIDIAEDGNASVQDGNIDELNKD